MTQDTTPEPRQADLAPAPVDQATPDPTPLMERLGLRYMASISTTMVVPDVADDTIHLLNEAERAAMAGIVRHGIGLSALIGALSGLATAIVEILTHADFIAPERLPAPPIVWIAVATVVATVVEIALIYRVCLRSVNALAQSAGLVVVAQQEEILRSLVRAALELPNSATPAFGINPRREISQAWLIAVGLIYKAKVSLTNFIFKALVRRMLARVGLRVLEALVAVPVVAIWDGAVCWKVLREARIRVLGPSAAQALTEMILPAGRALSPAGIEAVFAALAAAIMSQAELHPNLLAMVRELVGRFGEPPSSAVSNSKALMEALPTLPDDERAIALQFLCAAAALDGRLSWGERKLTRSAFEAAGMRWPIHSLKILTARLSNGEAVEPGDIEALIQAR